MPEIEFLVVANHAEARAGLLYLSGACWTDLWRGLSPGAPPPINHFGIGVAVLIPWPETNRKHHLTLRIENADGKDLVRVEGDVEVGRPVGIPEGSEQRAVIALNADLQFPSPGVYQVVAGLGDQVRHVSFRVHDEAQPSVAGV